jgi:7-cyano-7-deazaguanine synthase in queuosine biosynthesis
MAVILFSGGRDSSLAACIAAAKFSNPIHLLTLENGFGFGPRLVHFRIQELNDAFGDEAFLHHTVSVRGITQMIALRELEKDAQEFSTNLITLGSAAAMVARAAAFALSHGCSTVMTGYCGYQRHFPEQTDEALTWFEGFLAEYNLEFDCPVRQFMGEREVQDALLLYDISGKSLERSSAFADSFSPASGADVIGYLEKKRTLLARTVENHKGRQRRSQGAA